MAHSNRSALVAICILLTWAGASSAQRATRGTLNKLSVLATDGADSAPTDEGKSDISIPSGQLPGSVSGTVLDQTGAVMMGARVRLTQNEHSHAQEVLSGENGEYSFKGVPPGDFELTIAFTGFTTHVFSGALNSGEVFLVPPVVLRVANATQVWVKSDSVEVAQTEIEEQEKQRVLGFVPNFYVSYLRDAAPLSPRQKFRLAFKTTTDPFTSFGVAMIAGVEQATNSLEGYGQGWDGYAKRFGASYADVVTGTFIGSAVFPSLLKQDPRYFYKGTGSNRSRLLYAIASPVFCKGDNKKWQPNYSNVMGSFAAGGISYLYYPESSRGGLGLLARTVAIRLGETSLEGVLQEFLIPHLTPRYRKRTQRGVNANTSVSPAVSQ